MCLKVFKHFIISPTAGNHKAPSKFSMYYETFLTELIILLTRS